MATITLTMGNITIERTIPDERLTNILTTAFNPPPDDTLRRKLAFGLDSMLDEARAKARQNRAYVLRREAEQAANAEFD